MPITECAIVVQSSGDRPESGSETSSAHSAGFAVWTILFVVLGLIVLIIIRSSTRRSSKR